MSEKENVQRGLAPSGLLCRILRWLIRRDITKALQAIERITDDTRRLDEEAARHLDTAYERLYIARERMRHNAAGEPSGVANQEPKI